MDRFISMQAFVTVAKAGSFAAAARTMALSRSQVNRLVIQLEDHLQVSLLNRTTRKLSLTPIGQAYLPRARAILNDLDNIEGLISSENQRPTGDIKINAPMSFGTLYLGKSVVKFMDYYPDIHVQLILNDDLIDPVAQGFDMTVRISEPSDSLSLIEHTILPIPRILCASPDFEARYRDDISAAGRAQLSGLKQLPCLHYGNLPHGNRWKLIGPQGPMNIQVQGALCSNNGEVLCEAAVAGLGIVLLPTFIAGKDLQQGRLIRILPAYEATPLSLNLVYPPNRHLSERVRVFVKFMQQEFGEQAPWLGDPSCTVSN